MKFKFYIIALSTTLQIQYINVLIKSKQNEVFFPVEKPIPYLYNLKHE
jgi:hypothetical protein